MHQFFEGWLAGRLPHESEVFARLSGVLAADFTMVTPAGVRRDRRQTLQLVEEGYDRRHIRIWIEETVLLRSDPLLARYEEWQQTDDQPARGRISTVVFAPSADTPNGLEWVTVQETWLAR